MKPIQFPVCADYSHLPTNGGANLLIAYILTSTDFCNPPGLVSIPVTFLTFYSMF